MAAIIVRRVTFRFEVQAPGAYYPLNIRVVVGQREGESNMACLTRATRVATKRSGDPTPNCTFDDLWRV